ncbi:LOW QUALITY PROTEIN: lanC-like protein 2 [Procambarus clarkii]|uniref:LOW QUALITY PROTEIN: lanC-like protein 2 n=1 Tax=Procambarus clarkii TaxID=6728 RepID=UPI003741EC7C
MCIPHKASILPVTCGRWCKIPQSAGLLVDTNSTLVYIIGSQLRHLGLISKWDKTVAHVLVCAGMSEVRHFNNPYPRESGEDGEHILDCTTQKLSEEYTSKTWKNIKMLLNILDVELSKEHETSDTSVYTGMSGHVLLYLHVARVLNDDKYQQKARVLVDKVLQKLKSRRPSFLCGDTGPLVLGALVYHNSLLEDKVKHCITKIKELKREVLNTKSELPDELLYGRAGYLYALLFLQQKIGKEVVDDNMIRSVVTAILDSGRALSLKEKCATPLMYQWHEKRYIGAAHGIIGILFMLLQAKEHLSTEELHELIRPTVDYLCSLQFSSGNMPSSMGNPTDRLVHWCHGAPGAVFLFAKAYQVVL